MRIGALMGTSMSLKEVNLSDNAIDNDAAVCIAQYMSNAVTLSQVDLSCNEIAEQGAAALIEAVLHNAQLTSLILHGNPVSRVIQKKLGNMLDERLARNRVESGTVYAQHRARLRRSETDHRTSAAVGDL
uniref:Putative serine/threonine-protein kinase roco5 n=1 Tax=Lygus hesperus TaxID=30085 RepID=A0A0A9XY56_LYGHE